MLNSLCVSNIDRTVDTSPICAASWSVWMAFFLWDLRSSAILGQTVALTGGDGGAVGGGTKR